MAVHTISDETEEKLVIISANPRRDIRRIFNALIKQVKPAAIKTKKRPRRYYDAYDPGTRKFILKSRGLSCRVQYKGSVYEQTIKRDLGAHDAQDSKRLKALARREYKDELPGRRPSLSAVADPEVRALVADIRSASLIRIFTARMDRRYFEVKEQDEKGNKGLLEIAFDHGVLEFAHGSKALLTEIEIESKGETGDPYPGVREAMRNRILAIAWELGIKVLPQNKTKADQGFEGTRGHMKYYADKAKTRPGWKRDTPRK